MIYSSTLLSQFSEVVFGISTRFHNDLSMKGDPQQKKISSFFKEVGVSPQSVKRMRQIHSNTVRVIKKNDPRLFPETDGMTTRQKGIFLCVQTADCLPVFIFDPVAKQVGIIHAGYRGILAHIIENGLNIFFANGSDPKDVIIGVGPSIGKCCYNVDQDRIRTFNEEFYEFDNFSEVRDKEIYLDLKKIANDIFLQQGIKREHIEIMPYCTSCNNDIFFSYRKDSTEAFGEIVTVIGMR